MVTRALGGGSGLHPDQWLFPVVAGERYLACSDGLFGELTHDVIRRALRLLDREAWEARAREDMHRLRSEDLSAEPDEWEYDASGNIKITGTNLTISARPQDQS